MKRVLIIGATSAIAAACARMWAAEQAEFFLVGRDAEKLRQTAEDLQVRGATAVHMHVLDVNRFDDHAAMLDASFAALDCIDICLIAHGSLPDQRACETDADRALHEFSNNGLSVIALLTRLSGRMEAQRSGTIAVISSVAGDRGRRSNYLYGSAKAAVSAFCEGLRARLFASGVHLVTVKPGFVDTPMTKDLRLPAILVASPNRVATDILRAIERSANTIYTPWYWAVIMFTVRALPEFVMKGRAGPDPVVDAREKRLIAVTSLWMSRLGYLLIGCLAIAFFATVLPYFRPYPYSDDWIYPWPLDIASPIDFVQWAFGQHVDHRIPLQKALQFFVLKAADFDFRYAVAVNYIFACGLALLLLASARIYRGHASVGDLIIPLSVLNLGAGFSNWAFQFQFLSSVFFAGAFLYFAVSYFRYGMTWQLNAAQVCVVLTALCGINGLIMASLLTAFLAVFFVVDYRGSGSPRPWSCYALLAVCAIASGILWFSWNPSESSVVHHLAPAEIAAFVYGLLPSGFMFYATSRVWWKFALIFALLSAAVCALLWRIWRKRAGFADFALAATLAGTLLVILSVAIGRTSVWEKWDPVIGTHYGYLTILLPIASWILISSGLRAKSSNIVGLVLVLVFARAFQVNADWRYEKISTLGARQAEVLQHLATDSDVHALTAKYILDFCWTDGPYFRSGIEHGIMALRKIGAPIYGPPAPDQKDARPQ